MARLNELFPAGPPLDEETQIGRGPTIDALELRMQEGEKVKLLEPRRVGKSSAAGSVMERFRRAGLAAASVDLASVGGPAEAAEILRAQLSPGLAAIAQARKSTGWLADRIQTGLEGHPQAIAGVLADLAGLTSGPGAVLRRVAEGIGDQACAVLVDEAHHLASWPLAEQRDLRDVLRTDTRIGVIVSSSEASALERLTTDGGPLEYVGQRFRLPRIDRGDWEYELPRRFHALGLAISDGALALLLDEARGHPYCTMLLGREAARIAQPVGEVSEVIVQAALLVVAEDEGWDLRDDLG